MGVTIQTGQGSKKFLPLTNKSGQDGKLQVTVGQAADHRINGREVRPWLQERILP